MLPLSPEDVERATTVPAGLVATGPASGIGPGSRLVLTRPDGTFGCTANFVWTDGASYYLGTAGHCFLPAGTQATHGPGADYDPTRTRTRVCVSACSFGGQSGFIAGGTLAELGAVVYARQHTNGAPIGHDFGLVLIPTHLHPQIRPSMPVWGGPERAGAMATGDSVCIYGNGMLVGEAFPTMARSGVALTSSPSLAWTAAIASLQGDSGSGMVTCNAIDATGLRGDRAAGILTHITGGGIAGTSTQRAQQMALEAGLRVSLVLGSGGLESPTRLGGLLGLVPATPDALDHDAGSALARTPGPVANARGRMGASTPLLAEAEAHRVQLAEGETLRAQLTYRAGSTSAQGLLPDIDLGVWPAASWDAGRLAFADALARGTRPGAFAEDVNATAPAAGEYVVVAHGFVIGGDQDFTLTLSHPAPLAEQARLAREP